MPSATRSHSLLHHVFQIQYVPGENKGEGGVAVMEQAATEKMPTTTLS